MRETRKSGSVGAPGGRPPGATRRSERTGRDQIRFYRHSLASVTEVRGGLRVALASGYVNPSDLAPVEPVLDRSRALDWGLVHRRR